MTKMTKREKFAIVRAIIEASDHEMTDNLLEFVDHEVELLGRKSSTERKPTATQVANAVIKDAIIDAAEPDRIYTITEFIKEIPECAELTTQKVTSLCGQLVAEERLVRFKEKNKTYFKLA